MPDDQRPAGGGQAGKRDSSLRQARHHDGATRAAQYRIAYQEGQRALDDQQDELNGMRGRGVQFTAFVGAATAFLVGTGLQHPSRDATFYTLASLASLLSAGLIALILALLMPSRKNPWNYRMRPKILVEGWIEREVPFTDEAAMLREVALEYDEMYRKNEFLIKATRRAYKWLIVIGSAQVVLWASLVWVKG